MITRYSGMRLMTNYNEKPDVLGATYRVRTHMDEDKYPAYPKDWVPFVVETTPRDFKDERQILTIYMLSDGLYGTS